MFSEAALEKLNCEIACATYDKYETEIYGLYLCPSKYNEEKIREQKLLQDLLNFCKNNDCSFCDLNKIKLIL